MPAIETDYLVVRAGAAGVAFADALIAACDADAQKNRLCPANPYPDTALDWIPVTRISQRAEAAWAADPDLSSWLRRSRLNAARALYDHLEDPQMNSALTRLLANIEPAIAKLETFSAEIPQVAIGTPNSW